MLSLISLPDSSLQLSSMCMGNAAFGTGLPERETDRLYAAFREARGNCFDSAHCYCFWLPQGAGSSERALGDCIRRHGDSGKVRVITKGGHPAVQPAYPRPDEFLSPEQVASDIDQSLDRLQERIDLFLLHRDDTRVPVGEIISSLNSQITSGKIGAIGASNWSIKRLQAANDYASQHRLRGFVASQPQFSLAQPNATLPTSDPAMRYLTGPDIAWHTATGFPAICYSSNAGGYFGSAGQLGTAAYDNKVSQGRLARATQLARQLEVTADQIALAYLRCQPFAVIPILGTANVQHLHHAIAANAITLTPEQVRWLGSDPGV